MKEIKSLKDIRYKDYQHIVSLVNQGEEDKTIAENILTYIHNLTDEEINQLSIEEYEKALKDFSDVITETKFETFNVLKYDGVTYGLIPDFQKIKASELIDMDTLYSRGQIIELISILYRPIVGEINKTGEYRIETYKAFNTTFENLDAHHVLSVLNFFSKSFLTLKSIILSSTQMKETTI